ncbi:heterocyst frequency control protein PatD [Aetokthonos hydrillicola Thurmond2011]|jgi:hypothetical protein|uniref:Heterocyst frequency control protein PatD n=1 Tax=Aetokthonos hydrillicola Thurmond2011 TaxID=2712845 RepID=A0AAP5I8Y5_9CYAN|nr:heterocyst frequency control protein PatD [Aetokthonos hydrillicola]MBW4584846.1 heterocyst frequency control protein PatD [Aetokthonos hydrillicola CCALA 1050]MDR9895393.1 heterocyst frequency control protein PatD [Aetokthonos hydrillicola Thurmond2011]
MSLNHQTYHAFAIQLEKFRSYANANVLSAPQLRQYTTSLQQFFQQQIVPLEDTASPDMEREQSYRTEMSKQLRLLEIDVMFFQAARQASTAKVRIDAIIDRLTTLINYCNAIIEPKGEEKK